MTLTKQKNENGQVVYEKCSSGLEWWYEYNSSGTRIHMKGSSGYERKWNDGGIKIYFKNEEGYEDWYNDGGDLIHRKEPDGSEEWYDAMGVTIRIKFSDGTIQSHDESKEGKVNHLQYANGNEYKFDESGNLIYRKRAVDGKGYEYDSVGNVICEIDSCGGKRWYNAQGKLIHELDVIRDIERWYDEQGHLIHIKRSNRVEYWWAYDSNGEIIYYKDHTGYEEWYTYDTEYGEITNHKTHTTNPYLK
jgi:YD repeat-containing protein